MSLSFVTCCWDSCHVASSSTSLFEHSLFLWHCHPCVIHISCYELGCLCLAVLSFTPGAWSALEQTVLCVSESSLTLYSGDTALCHNGLQACFCLQKLSRTGELRHIRRQIEKEHVTHTFHVIEESQFQSYMRFYFICEFNSCSSNLWIDLC